MTCVARGRGGAALAVGPVRVGRRERGCAVTTLPTIGTSMVMIASAGAAAIRGNFNFR
jgi:hypothetical protein